MHHKQSPLLLQQNLLCLAQYPSLLLALICWMLPTSCAKWLGLEYAWHFKPSLAIQEQVDWIENAFQKFPLLSDLNTSQQMDELSFDLSAMPIHLMTDGHCWKTRRQSLGFVPRIQRSRGL